MVKKIMNFFKDEEGATAVEYGVMVAAIAGVIITIVVALGNTLVNVFTDVNGAMSALPS